MPDARYFVFHTDYIDPSFMVGGQRWGVQRGGIARVMDNPSLVGRILEEPYRATDITSLREQSMDNVITFARHNITGVGDESAKLQGAVDEACETGKLLVGDPVTVGLGSIVYYGSNFNFLGRGARIEKRFNAGGADGALRCYPGEELNTNNIKWEDIEFGSDVWFDGNQGILGDGEARNKPVLAWGNNFVTRNITIRRWSGFGFTTGGFGHSHHNLRFIDPFPGSPALFPANADGLHVVYGEGHNYDGVRGASGDDLVAIIATLTGERPDQDIRNIIVRGVFGRSLWARLIGIGTFNATMSATHEDILVEGFEGTGAAASGGVATVLNLGGGTARNITLRNGRLAPRILGAEPGYLDDGDATGPATLSGLRVFSTGTGGIHNLRFENLDVKGGRERCLQTVGEAPINGFAVVGCKLDGSECSGEAVTLATPMTGICTIQAEVLCGASHGLTLFGPASGASKQIDFDLRILNIPSNRRGVNNSRCSHSTFRIREVTKAEGATGVVGYFEAGTADNNWVHDSSLTGVDTPVQRVSPGTRLDRVEGFTSPGQNEPGDGDGSGGQLAGRCGFVEFSENQASFYVVLDPPEPNASYSVQASPQVGLNSSGDPNQKITPSGLERNTGYFRIDRHVAFNNAAFQCGWQLIRTTDGLQTGGAAPPD